MRFSPFIQRQLIGAVSMSSASASTSSVSPIHESLLLRLISFIPCSPTPTENDSRETEMTNAKKSCWTCKSPSTLAHCLSNHRLMKADRKIGCDKTLPACNNCIRTNRVCAGFGVKLIWPETFDGRRKSVIRGVDHHKSHSFCQTLAVDFLNTTTEDVEVSHLYNLTNWAQNSHPLRLSTRTLPTYSLPGFTSDDASLLSYCECTLGRLMSRV